MNYVIKTYLWIKIYSSNLCIDVHSPDFQPMSVPFKIPYVTSCFFFYMLMILFLPLQLLSIAKLMTVHSIFQTSNLSSTSEIDDVGISVSGSLPRSLINFVLGIQKSSVQCLKLRQKNISSK